MRYIAYHQEDAGWDGAMVLADVDHVVNLAGALPVPAHHRPPVPGEGHSGAGQGRRAPGHCSERGPSAGAYNLVAPQQVRSREFAETLTRVVGAPPPRRSPALLARVFLGAGADIVLGGRRVVPAGLNGAGYEFAPTTSGLRRGRPGPTGSRCTRWCSPGTSFRAGMRRSTGGSAGTTTDPDACAGDIGGAAR